MATAMVDNKRIKDRSKYRNPDMPVGYVKQEPELKYKMGIVIDGVHYVWAPYIYDAHMEEREDFHTLSDMILSDEEVNKDSVKNVVENPGPSTSGIISPNSNAKEDEIVIIEQESSEFGGTRRKSSKYSKKSKARCDEFDIDTSFCLMDIDSERHERKKKNKKSEKNRRIEYRSDSTDSDRSHRRSPSTHKRRIYRHHSPSTSRRHHSPSTSHRYRSPSNDKYGKIVTYTQSISPSPEHCFDVKIKKEFKQKIKQEPMEPDHLFGSYICDVCNITMNSQSAYDAHIIGKKHRKNLKLKNVPQVVVQRIPATVVSEHQSKYPKVPPGVIRKKVSKTAEIQHVIQNKIKRPCPGLNYVTEIQGIGCTQYYCSMCDCVCSSSCISAHLTGYKHQVNSLKIFEPGTYETIQFQPKFRIQQEILSILNAVQTKEGGMGRMAVEVEELAPDFGEIKSNLNEPGPSRDRRSQSSTTRDCTSQPSTTRDCTSQPSTTRDRTSQLSTTRDLTSQPSTSRGTGHKQSDSFLHLQ